MTFKKFNAGVVTSSLTTLRFKSSRENRRGVFTKQKHLTKTLFLSLINAYKQRVFPFSLDICKRCLELETENFITNDSYYLLIIYNFDN